ncbi:MAG TPA: arylsulfotransferase family protein [Rubrobacter sp.]|nr:arylsulfotransferase family protein [Rubrobacter sp.]
MSRKFTRQKFLGVAGTGAAYIALLSLPGCRKEQQSHSSPPAQPDNVRTFRSRPDLSPPAIEIHERARGSAPGYIFIAAKKGAGQDGPMIVDDLGRPVWFSKDRYATDFKVQRYRGEPVLTWWQGEIVAGHGEGEYVIFDDSYREITRVQAGNGYRGDLHEFSITQQDTALLTLYVQTQADLSPIGGPKDGMVWEGIAQELDLETEEVLFEWRSLEHVGVEESYREPPQEPTTPLDYFHINSIDIDFDGNWLISAKGTSAVYKVDRQSGEILWRLGGKESDFQMGEGTRTVSQHDARRQQDGTITIFDNGAPPQVHEQSRTIAVSLDMDEMSAALVREYTHPQKLIATSQGNAQVLPNGNVFVGWGSSPFFSEYTKDGKLHFDAEFPGSAQSYRAFRFPWKGDPVEEPAVAVDTGPDDRVTLFASWNGATEVESWEALAGPGPDQLEPVGTSPRHGFETTLTMRTAGPYVAVRAKSAAGQVLGTTRAIKLGAQTS